MITGSYTGELEDFFESVGLFLVCVIHRRGNVRAMKGKERVLSIFSQ